METVNEFTDSFERGEVRKAVGTLLREQNLVLRPRGVPLSTSLRRKEIGAIVNRSSLLVNVPVLTYEIC